MPNLIDSLQGRDQGHLLIIARLWGIELDEKAGIPADANLAESLLDQRKVSKMVGELPGEARRALDDLIKHSGRLPWAQFTRSYGEVREMGAAKRDRERPYERPISAVEILWYRALVAKSFFDVPTGPEEFAYIPDDLLEMIAPPSSTVGGSMGRAAAASEYTSIAAVDDRLLDHACTLLALLRMGIAVPETFQSTRGETLTGEFLTALLKADGLLDDNRSPLLEPVRVHLEAERGEAILELFKAWKDSSKINELALLPNLALEGNWKNDPLEARHKVLGFLSTIPTNTWWNMASFVSTIKAQDPDYQRPAGNYDSWFIRSKETDEYLRGFEHWDEVDGRLVRYILTGPLHWMGVIDLAGQGEGPVVIAFRLSRWSKALLNSKPPTGLPKEQEVLVVRSDARVSARRLVPRRIRYQVARFCDWEKESADEYQYRISPASLNHARQQGLTVSQLVTLINRNARAVPPSLIKALERWEKQGVEARMEEMVVLRVVSEDVLQALRKSRASRFLGEALGPNSVAINAGAADKVLAALAELGYLGEIRIEKQ